MVSIDAILDRVRAGERLAAREAVTLLSSGELQKVGRLADETRRRKHPDGVVSYLVDRNINYTNICTARCKFCNFRRPRGHAEGYLLDLEAIFKKIEETIALGGTGILMQGGMNPDLKVDFYERLLLAIRQRYNVHLHCFSPPEIVLLSRVSGISVREAIRRLRAAGLDSIPGGGAEILVERVRRANSPGKCTVEQWLDVMRTAHQEGLLTTATMMMGEGETLEERVEHLDRIRRLQDETGGFVAFIPWNVQLQDTELSSTVRRGVSAVEYLMLLAVSRIFLDNVANLQVSWLTQGLQVAQLALHFGANDVGSIMIEENVMRSAGLRVSAGREDLLGLIRAAGFTPAQRDTLYRIFLRISA